MRQMARFVLDGTKLYPGAIPLNDNRIRNEPFAVEVRRAKREAIPYSSLKKLRRMEGEILVDAGSTDHKEVTDLLILGFDLVTVSALSPLNEIGISHSLSQNVLTSLVLDTKGVDRVYWLEQEVIPLLEQMIDVAPRPLLLSSREESLLEWVWQCIPEEILKSYEWWMAPAEGKKLKLRNRPATIRRWLVNGETMIRNRR